MRCIAESVDRIRESVPNLPTPEVLLRGFHPRDLPAVARIVADALHEHYDSSLYYSLSQQWPAGFLIAADGSDAPVGFLLGVTQVEGEARVLMFAVERGWRTRGVGTTLMNEFLERCRARSMRRTTLEVRVSNVAAIRFYTRFRFSVTDLLRGYYSDGESGYQMARDMP
ncbi:MAG TPA: GNAT family N-acetyltransferase [Thermoplasmata archaeon]|nr:GNAT family N-acetyltransferase [Thermoplasmata archaeon]